MIKNFNFDLEKIVCDCVGKQNYDKILKTLKVFLSAIKIPIFV